MAMVVAVVLQVHPLLTIAFSLLLGSSLCKSTTDVAAGNGGRREGGGVKGMFVFGSSMVDNGNNNFLWNSTARADYLPYGIDFPSGPSGRFSNGRNSIDALGELLKLPSLIPPFADPRTKGRRIAHGVNYASGGSGILDTTGSLAGQVMSLSMQIDKFEKRTLPKLKQLQFGVQDLPKISEEYLFVVGTGGNDYLLNYFVRSEEDRPSLPHFTASLISTFSAQIKKLYNLGARKFVVFSIQAMGCAPVVRTASRATNGSCVEAMNQAAMLFNSHLKSLADTSKQTMPDSIVVYVNTYKIIRDIIDNPIKYGFKEASKACCQLSALLDGDDGNGILCRRRGRVCAVREDHVFFDGLHPTDAVNIRIAMKAYASALKDEAYPINVKDLAML